VHRALLVRLAVATAVIAAVIAAITYFTLEARLKQRVVDYGRLGLTELVRDVQETMAARFIGGVDALRDVLNSGDSRSYYAGKFVAVQFYDKSLRSIAEQWADDQPAMDAVRTFLASRPFRAPGAEPVMAETVHIGDNLYVFLRLPVTDKEGVTQAYARGLFIVSPEMLREMSSAIGRNVLLVVAIVFAVAAVLYPVILQLMRRLADYSTGLLDANLETMAALGSAIAKRDSDTDAHNYRVTLYAAKTGEAMGLPGQHMRTLIKGSFLHDVGKIGIPDNILLKPGKLDEQEFGVMKTHVEKGIDIVRRSKWLTDAVRVVGDHHEKYAGGGYPNNLSGEGIPLEARIFAVADVFDALTSQRPYKKPLSFEATMDALEQGRAQHFDPRVLDSFGGIARHLYEQYTGHEGDDLRRELESLVERYFSGGMEALRYRSS